MSLAGLGKSVSGAFGVGLNAGTGLLRYSGGAGAMLGLGATGAAIGAGATAGLSDGSIDPLAGAAVGGVVGAAALPVAGFTAGTVGSAAFGLAKIGKGAAKLGIKASPYVAGVGIAATERVASSIWNVGSKLIDWNEDAQFFDKVQFSGPIKNLKKGWESGKSFTSIKEAKGFTGKSKAIGKNLKTGIGRAGRAAKEGMKINGSAVLTGIGLYEGAQKAWKTLETAKMGQMTGTTTLTPQIPSYADNAGATGDLVFALNANRRG